MKQVGTFTAIAFGFTLLTFSDNAQADDAQTLAKIDQLLPAVQAFEYGRGGDPPTELERIIYQLPANSPLRATVEQKLIDAIDNANQIGSSVICRQLRVVGSDACIPAVAKMLEHPHLSHFARYALEGIGSPAALEAMHGAMNETSSKLQIGLINSLSDSGYQPMRADCVGLLSSSDSAVASASARALGRLGDTESIAALTTAHVGTAGQLLLDIDLALLNCAAKLLSEGKTNDAARIYTTLYQPGGPFQHAGLRGLVLAQPDKAADLLVKSIQPDDLKLAAYAISLTTHVTGADATAKFVALLPDLPAEGQVLMLKALGARGDVNAAPAMMKAIQLGNESVQLASLEALGGLPGEKPAIDALIEAAATRTDAGAKVAHASLSRMAGDRVDAILTQVAKAEDAVRSAAAIKALSSRSVAGIVPMLQALARDDKPETRAAAIEAIGVHGGQAEIAALLQLADSLRDPTDLQVMETSLGRVLMRIGNRTDCAKPLLAVLPCASAALRPILIKQLSKSGTSEALTAVRAALGHSDTATSDAAVAALAKWPNTAGADDLIRLLGSARTSGLKTMALSGYFRIAAESGDQTAMLFAVLKKTGSVSDKKLVLNEIGLNSESTEALEMAQPLLSETELQAAAAIATIRIANKLRNRDRDAARKALKNVVAKVGHPDVQKRARKVLDDMDK